MTPDDRACIALDLGGATTSAALLGRVDGRWRLLGAGSAPAAIPPDALLATLARRLGQAEPALARELDVAGLADGWPRLVARTGPAPRMAVLAATERSLARFDAAARRAGWSVTSASAETTDPLEMTRIVLRRDVSAVLVGAGDPPATDERSVIADLAALVAAAAERRPELTVVISGGMADHSARFETPPTPTAARPTTLDREEPGAGAHEPGSGSSGRGADGSGASGPAIPTLIIAAEPLAGDPPGESLRALLDDLRVAPDDGRRAMVRTTATLAANLGRRVETLDIGHGSGLRVVARPAGAGARTHVRWATVAEAALVPDPVDDATVDGALAWSTLPIDRYRLRDRLAELRIAPWSEAHGDGAPLRLAAARAALGRLVALTPDLDRPVPDLVVVAGGAWAVAPGAAVGLAIADVVRRPGATQLTFDHARLLGPLGMIEDDGLRASVVADLADDLLAPLGSIILPAGLRAGRSAGRLVVHAAAGTTELDLVPGGLELVDLPPGESAVAELDFRDDVVLATRGRRFAVEVAGGLGGLLIDLRDVPLHLPDRADRRRELLAAWQRALWPGLDS